MSLLSNDVVSAKLKSVAKNASKLRQDIQELAVQAIGYSIIHGDIRIAQRLFDAVGKSVRRQSLVTFLEKHGQMYFSTADKKFLFRKVEGIEFNYDELMELPWDEAKAEVLVSEFDIEKQFEAFMKKIEGAYKKHADTGLVIKNSALFDHLESARIKYSEEKMALKATAREESKVDGVDYTL